MVEANLPAGFRFHPRDEELVCDYLMKKITHSEQPPILMEVDLNKSEPWDIPEYACVGGKEWYFYSQRDRKYSTGLRTNRATVWGYWKATGKDRPVLSRRNRLVGMRKTLVFYQGRAPKGKKTDWVMHEFRLEGPIGPPKLSSSKEDWVICRVFYKNKEVDHHTGPGGSKQGGINGYDQDTYIISSSSTYNLPPLMDDPPLLLPRPYNEYQTHHHQSSLYEQVPCFSIFNPPINQMNIISSKFTTTNSSSIPNTFGDQLINGSTCCEDKMVIDAVLNHLTKMDNNNNNNTNNMMMKMKMMMTDSPCSFGEAASTSESFLSEVETIWNNY